MMEMAISIVLIRIASIIRYAQMNRRFVMMALIMTWTATSIVLIWIAPVIRHVYVPKRVSLAHQVRSAVPVYVTLLKKYANRLNIAEMVIK
jgi:hypothetical protein